jgi:hypothetical protein
MEEQFFGQRKMKNLFGRFRNILFYLFKKKGILKMNLIIQQMCPETAPINNNRVFHFNSLRFNIF